MFVEDILDYYVTKIGVDTSDRLILESIWRQLQKGTALTDRQYALVCTKLKDIESTLKQHNILLDDNIPLKYPLREIDRSKYIKIVDTAEVYSDMVYESYKQNFKWIKIRFPFNKKTITLLQEVLRVCNVHYLHHKGSHEHFLHLTERSAFETYKIFKGKNFTIDPQITNIATNVEKLLSREDEFLPCYKKGIFSNIKEKCKENIHKELPNLNNLLIQDRRLRYGLNYVDNAESPNELTNKIISRDVPLTQIGKELYSETDLLTSIIELERLPLLVVIDSLQPLDQLREFYNASKYVIDSKKQICLFRVDNTPEYNMNDFIKDNKFNNYLDNSIEIVYISSAGLPKLLLKTEWKPLCVVSYTGSIVNNNVLTYCKDVSDLIILFDTFVTASRTRWSTNYGNL